MERIYLSPPHMGPDERELLLAAFDSNWIAPLGPHVDAFEQEFSAAIGSGGYAAALSSGTAAIHLALIALGVQPGADVITSSLTFAATANPIRYVGARPVFIDSDAASWTMSVELLEEEMRRRAAQGKLPAAVIAVDLYGQTADMGQIARLAAEFDVPLIEDAAEALGATCDNASAGTLGDIGVFSFNGNKIITTSGGGMLVSRRREWVDQARFLATQAREPVAHYEHKHIGYNYRLSNLLAAVGRGQLRQLPARVARRRAINAKYRELLGAEAGLAFMPEAPWGRSSCWLTCVLIQPDEFGCSREQVRLALDREGIEARPVWKPLHLQDVFADCPCVGGAVSERLFNIGLCLPSGSSLSDEQIVRIAGHIRGCGAEARAAQKPVGAAG